MLSSLILAAYALALLGLVVYSLHRGWLLLTYRRSRRRPRQAGEWRAPLPAVTVQLPVYNERYVVERLIDAACALDYPRESLQIQVLDDSSDKTAGLARSRVRHVLLYVPLILAIGIGISVNNTRALLAGLAGRGHPEFVRTPKRGESRGGYRSRFSAWGTLAETLLAGYVALAVVYALVNGLYPSIPFLLLFQYGFTTMVAGSVTEREGNRWS